MLNRRAFWTLTPTLAAIVASSLASASPKRPSSWVLWTLMTPIARLADDDRDAEVRARTAFTTAPISPSSGIWLSRRGSASTACAADRADGSRPAPRHARRVGEGEHPARLVVDGDADHLRVEHVAHTVADELVDGQRVELPDDRGLEAAAQRQLGVPLPCLLDEARVLDADPDARCDRDEATVGRTRRTHARGRRSGA